MRKVLVTIPLILGAIFPMAAQAVCCKCIKPTDPKVNICINTTTITDCPSLKTASLNASIKSLDCQAFPENVIASQCQPVATGGVCSFGPTDELVFKLTVASEPSNAQVVTAVPPTLGVPIPNLTFASNLMSQGGFLEIPWFAQYIVAVQGYLIGISVVAAAVMIVYGGFLYIVGASGAKITSGKKIITDAVIGLVLVFGAYLILSTINPSTVQLQTLKIQSIPKIIQKMDSVAFQGMGALAASEYTPNPETVEAVKNIKGKKPPPTRMRPDNPFDTREVLDADEINQVAEYISKKAGVNDTCIVKAMIGIESGNAMNAIGHDEDAPLAEVQSRLNFLRGGLKWSKATFAPADDLPGDCASDMDICGKILKSTQWIRFYNDDTTITSTPPDFGLDWRYSHGIGLTQLTIFPNGCKGKSGELGLRHPATGNICWTTPMLLTLEGTIDLTVAALRTMADKGASMPCDFFNGWAGKFQKGGDCYPLVQKKLTTYKTCTAKK